MAKLLTQEQFIRAYECAELGCITNHDRLAQLLADPDYDALHEYSAYFGKAATQIVCISDLQSMEELHFVAGNLNWDDHDPDMVRAIIEHPLCDAGTALLLLLVRTRLLLLHATEARHAFWTAIQNHHRTLCYARLCQL
ncbi:DUF4274 domain-containing protein [Shewanella sp. MR-4]|uniref:DUF4274 domain-containing protein n=1 Tax=Shewanella sp. (strain MR-4) TaxID=60480 RepID=UPI000313DEA7|nr:DUF4274 domain-containing protein [Shewanella sp. MR-4]